MRGAKAAEVRRVFGEVFGHGARIGKVYFAPGRINLIGEHIDYNGGAVLPCAIGMGTYLAAAPNDLGLCRFYSSSHEADGILAVPMQRGKTRGASEGDGCVAGNVAAPEKTGMWIDYPLGVFRMFAEKGFSFAAKGGAVRRGALAQRSSPAVHSSPVAPGYDFFYWSDLPEGAGFSSSASIEMATALALQDLLDTDFQKKELALLCQQAESTHIGVQCGIMDQLAVALGKKGHAILLDTAALGYRYVPLHLTGVKLMVVNSNKKRALTDGGYNAVRRKNALAQEVIRQVRQADGYLCHLTEKQLRHCALRLKEAGVLSLVHHMVSEHGRTLQACEAMEAADMYRLGQLLQASHHSLQHDLGVSCLELDVLAETANGMEGVLGARMMGGGFGGCILALVKEDAAGVFMEGLAYEYKKRMGKEATFYPQLDSADGAGVIDG